MLDQNITLSARCTQHNERPLYHYSINKLRTYLNHDHKQYVIVVNSNENEPIKICHSKMVMAFIKLRIIKMVSLGNEPRFRVPRTDSSAMHYRIATVLKCNTNCISLNRICKPCGYVLVLLRFQKFCCQSVFARKNRGFRFGFCLSRFPPVVNVVCLRGPLQIKPAAVRYIFLCITPVDSSKYPTAWDW